MTGSLITQNGRWYVDLSYKDPISGSWKRTKRSTGLKSSVKNKSKAKALIPDIIARYRYLEQTPEEQAKNISFIDFIISYEQKKAKSSIANSTKQKNSYLVPKILKYFPKELKLNEVSTLNIQSFMDYLLTQGKTNQKTGESEPMAPRTVKDYKSFISSACSSAVRTGLLQNNPCTNVKIEGKNAKRPYEYLTMTELKEYIRYIHSYDPKLAICAWLAAFYSLRRSEFMGLKWRAINFETNTIIVEHTVTRLRTLNAEDRTKSESSHRRLPLVSIPLQFF